MSAGIPLLVLVLLGSIINVSWMFGRRRGRQFRIVSGGLLLLVMLGSITVLGLSGSGIWSEAGSAAFATLWLTSISMILLPLIDNATFSK